MLSAVSQQIQAIQECLKAKAIDHGRGNSGSQHTVELIGKQVQVNTDMAIFITMNPDYAGLPTHQLNSILWLLTIKDRCKKVRFQQTHNQGLRQLLLTVFWDLRA